MATEQCLFIGGSWDGKKVLIDIERMTCLAPVAEGSYGPLPPEIDARDAPCTLQTYVRTSLISPERKHYVYVLDGHTHDVIGKLVSGYVKMSSRAGPTP